MSKEIDILRSFVPESIEFGINENTNDSQWEEFEGGSYTFFQTVDQYVKVLFTRNDVWDCIELSFKTVLKSKVNSLEEANWFCSYLPDPDMLQNCNRATKIFRYVVFITLQKINSYSCVGFNGATPFLDRIYTRLDQLKYFTLLLNSFNYCIVKRGRDIFLKRNYNVS
jgi:hypothetical protein